MPKAGKFWVSEPEAYLEPRGEGTIGGTSDPAKTIIDVFENITERFPDRPALCVKKYTQVTGDDGKKKNVLPEDWTVWTYTDYLNDCRKFAKSLCHLNVTGFKIINIIGFNSPEWFIANCGAIVAGCISAGIYSTNLPESCHYITEHSKAEVLCVDSNQQLVKYAKKKFPHLKAIVMWNETPDPKTVAACTVPVHTWEAFLEIGSGVGNDVLDLRRANVNPGNCSTLIYTSGTTGPPKAVMVSHDNITWTTGKVLSLVADVNHTDRFVSYLPLSHIAAQVIDLHGPMSIGACTYFAQTDAMKGTLKTTMCDVRPTIFFGVPRVWEKFQEAMVDLGRKTEGITKQLAAWAKGLGKEHCRMQQYGEGGGAPCCYSCANSVILTKIKTAIGLDQAKGCFTAAAPISPDTLWYFASLDIPVYEVFGQSECTGPHTISMEGQWKIGTCGRPMPGTVSKGDKDSELCYAGRHIFMGYMYMPEKTAETIDDEGFLHSGDIGEFDEDTQEGFDGPSGFLRITGRIKDLIITAGGENVPPILIENEIKSAGLAISNAMVVGDKRKYLAAIITLKVVMDKETMEPTEKLAPDSLHVAKEIGSDAKTVEEAISCAKFKAYIDAAVKTANSKTTSQAQIVQKWKYLEKDFCEKAGDLTPTMKLKRNVVTEKLAGLIDEIYGESA